MEVRVGGVEGWVRRGDRFGFQEKVRQKGKVKGSPLTLGKSEECRWSWLG